MRLFTIGLLLAAFGLPAAAEDRYQERETRFHREGWQRHIFMHVRSDLDHIWAGHAADRERQGLIRAEQELTQMQADLEHGP